MPRARPNSENRATRRVTVRTPRFVGTDLEYMNQKFREQECPSRQQREEMAEYTSTSEHKVKIWFQNRRQGLKRRVRGQRTSQACLASTMANPNTTTNPHTTPTTSAYLPRTALIPNMAPPLQIDSQALQLGIPTGLSSPQVPHPHHSLAMNPFNLYHGVFPTPPSYSNQATLSFPIPVSPATSPQGHPHGHPRVPVWSGGRPSTAPLTPTYPPTAQSNPIIDENMPSRVHSQPLTPTSAPSSGGLFPGSRPTVFAAQGLVLGTWTHRQSREVSLWYRVLEATGEIEWVISNRLEQTIYRILFAWSDLVDLIQCPQNLPNVQLCIAFSSPPRVFSCSLAQPAGSLTPAWARVYPPEMGNFAPGLLTRLVMNCDSVDWQAACDQLQNTTLNRRPELSLTGNDPHFLPASGLLNTTQREENHPSGGSSLAGGPFDTMGYLTTARTDAPHQPYLVEHNPEVLNHHHPELGHLNAGLTAGPSFRAGTGSPLSNPSTQNSPSATSNHYGQPTFDGNRATADHLPTINGHYANVYYIESDSASSGLPSDPLFHLATATADGRAYTPHSFSKLLESLPAFLNSPGSTGIAVPPPPLNNTNSGAHSLGFSMLSISPNMASGLTSTRNNPGSSSFTSPTEPTFNGSFSDETMRHIISGV
ncbi:hypothetical protein BJ085DRAFT_36817 [Dimargaris cristalligena]|uniref:Homeobox domain-containing protein n=1 Tax=Dimargaris cristalligena TaxID=215637 RepID=A0A4P9ZU34_9FUNG|nr:hypothetical protein BJ085DRAFT_36817 [Dimargaris cristalligena]|eukprot:RKP36292.1 hypothetical protein BJ085DRAFT_36817 [Dimargaris cristalligena]